MIKAIAAIICGIIIGLIGGSIFINQVNSSASKEIYTCPPPDVIKQHVTDFAVWEYQNLPWMLVENQWRTQPTTDINIEFKFAQPAQKNLLVCSYQGLDANNQKVFFGNFLVSPNYKTIIQVKGGQWLGIPAWLSWIPFLMPNTSPICYTGDVLKCPFHLKEMQ